MKDLLKTALSAIDDVFYDDAELGEINKNLFILLADLNVKLDTLQQQIWELDRDREINNDSLY